MKTLVESQKFTGPHVSFEEVTVFRITETLPPSGAK